MPVHCIQNNTEHPLFWYKRSHLLLHNNRVYAVDTSNHLAALLLKVVTENNIKVEVQYPPVPFCPLRYLIRVQSLFRIDRSLPITHNVAQTLIAQPISFYPMRHLPGDPGYIPHIAGRTRDFLTPNIKLVRSWMKRVSQEKLGKKRLALAMALHPRLGEGSPLMELGADLVWAILFDARK